MDSHVLRKAAWRLPALADLAVLRFNTRGTSSPRGTSQGQFDGGDAEQYDVEAAIAFAASHHLPRRWLLGWSFGTDLALKWGCVPEIEGAILLSPPLARTSDADLARWDESGKPVIAIVPELDDFLRPAEAIERFRAIGAARVIPVEKGRHLWVGEHAVRRVLNEIVAVVNPEAAPLPDYYESHE
jgi:alpha/beta superfamily hydrolase